MSDPTRSIAIVTDSTADIPDPLVQELGITVVPLRINFGEESFRDGLDLTTEAFVDRLVQSETLPTTSQPTVHEFAAAFQDQLDQGREIVCVTISSRLSGTWNAASAAAEQEGSGRVIVIDGGSMTMQLGWVAIEAARTAMRGADRDTVQAAAESAKSRTNLFAVLKTLDYVYKGGRIGRVSQVVGSALGIKPIIAVRDGTLVPLERVRTWKKALRRMVELVEEEGDLSDIIVLYNSDRDEAEALQAELSQLHPDATVLLGRAGAVISTHAGPGAVGIATLRRA